MWSPDRRAEALLPQRDDLVRRLPRVFATAGPLTEDEREFVVDDALTYVVMQYEGAISSEEEALAVFWRAAQFRIARRRFQSRGATIRAGYTRASETELDGLADGTNDPAELAEKAAEFELAAEFAATLDELEGRVLRAKWLTGTAEPVGYRKVADALDITPARSRQAERSIAAKLERFATLCAAGRLCAERSAEIAALASGTVVDDQAVAVAKAHLKHCSVCRTDYTAQMRAMKAASFQRHAASLVPAAGLAEPARRHAGQLRDLVADWAGRSGVHDTAASASQVVSSGVGRGATGALAIKIAAVLAAGAAVVGVTKTVTKPDHQRAVPRATATPTPRPTPSPTPTTTSIAAPNLQRAVAAGARAAKKPATHAAGAQGGTGPSDHEQEPVSPAASGSLPNGQSEFEPGPADSAPPAAAPTSQAPGSSEFP